MLGWLRRWRQKKLARRPLPEEWLAILDTHVPFYRELPEHLRSDFLDKLKIFVWDKYFIPAGGMEITDRVKVVISAIAVRLILHLDISYYDRLTEIVVYPSHYRHPDQEEGITFGEAHQWGTMVLSWEAVLEGLQDPHDGHDTAMHEFAHVLDIGAGQFNGTPALRSLKDYRSWGEVMSKHYLELKEWGPRQRKVLDMYGAINEAEFFAVATESFFERPHEMRESLPDLYDELRRFYGWDPAQPLPETRTEPPKATDTDTIGKQTNPPPETWKANVDESPNAPSTPPPPKRSKWNIQKGGCHDKS